MSEEYQDYWKNAHIDTVWHDREGNERLRMTAEFKALVFDCLRPIAEADRSRVMKEGKALLFLSVKDFEDALTDIPEVRDALNDLTDAARKQELIVNYFWQQLPAWSKSSELFASTFRTRIVDPEMLVSHGYYRGNLRFVSECVYGAEQKYTETQNMGF